jgi:hypothetical protein
MRKASQPYKARGDRWFYLDARELELYQSQGNGTTAQITLPMTALFRALDKAGLLDQWDRKQQVFTKPKAKEAGHDEPIA